MNNTSDTIQEKLHRQNASKYLKEVKLERSRYYVNIELFNYLKKAVNE